MNTVISLIAGSLFAAFCASSLRRHPVPYYIGATVISALTFAVQLAGAARYFPAVIADYVWPVFFRGGLAGAFFVIVMWTGALPMKSALIKHLMPIRGELSILACILGLGHSAANIMSYTRYLFSQPARMSAVTRIFVWVSIAMVLIMLPLFVTSFKSIRRKMKAAVWKKLQRLAYVFYGLLFAHLTLLYVPYIIQGKDYRLSYTIYCLIFISYALCRICKAVFKKKTVNKTVIYSVCGIVTLVAAGIIFICLTGEVRTSAASSASGKSAASLAESSAEAGNKTATAEDKTAASENESDTIGNSEALKENTSEINESSAATEKSSAEGSTSAATNKESPEDSAPESAKTGPAEGSDSETGIIKSADATPQQEDMPPAADNNSSGGALRYENGTYYGTGAGYEGDITVAVTIDNDRIIEITVVDNIEDPEFFESALQLIGEVLNLQNTDMDAVSGSTFSSYGILDAIDDALASARKLVVSHDS